MSEGIGSVNLANATLETYFQGHLSNGQAISCFLCHNTGGSNSPTHPYPGKDINISHIILGLIPAPPTPTPTPCKQAASPTPAAASTPAASATVSPSTTN